MIKPIRVLHVFAQMNRGGAETMIMNLYRNIDRSIIQFDFIVHTDKKCAYDDEINSLGGKIHRLPRYEGKNHFQYKKAWIVFLKSNPEYKVIHGHVRSTASIYLRIAKKYGLTTIAHSHSTSSGKGVSAIIKNILQYPIRYTADYLFACSKSAGEWLYGKRASNKNNFYILNNAIDATKYEYDKNIRLEKRKEFQIENKLVIGHIGRFSAPKNHTFLIDIFKTVHDKNDNAVLLLVGDGEQRSLIENKVNELGLYDNVIFTGVREDIPELLQAMDIFLFPSIYEGLPVTLVEAQASGLPCVISDRITKEVAVTNLLRFISLEEKVEYWADTLLETSSSNKRDSNYLKIVEAGYDIKSVTKWYAEFYGSKVKEAIL